MEAMNAEVKRLIGDALEDVRRGLAPVVSSHLANALGPQWRKRVLAGYQRRRTFQGDASAADLTGDVGVLLTIILQEWDVLRTRLPGCRHWVDMLRVLRNVWAHASELGMPVAVMAYTAAFELAARAGLANRRRIQASRNHLSKAASIDANGRTARRVRTRRTSPLHTRNQSVTAPLLLNGGCREQLQWDTASQGTEQRQNGMMRAFGRKE